MGIIQVFFIGLLVAGAFDAKRLSPPLHKNKLTGILFFMPVSFPIVHSDPVVVVGLSLVYWILLWATAIDLQDRIVYDWQAWSVFGVAVALTLHQGNWANFATGVSIATALGLGMKLIGFVVYGKEASELDYGFGDGDFLLIMALGGILGLQTVPFFFWSLMVSFVVSVVLMIMKKVSRNDPIPFVPFIAIGFLATVLVNPDMQVLRDFVNILFA